MLYPEIEPFESGFIKVSELHTIYYEQSGNPEGKPVIAFHGGPGDKSNPHHRRFFNPDIYRTVLFDQRGCGRSKPLGEIQKNTTQNLIADAERIREKLGIGQWFLVYGRSWGSTLALLYSETYPEKVNQLMLGGIFTFSDEEIEWFYNGARRFFPDLWEATLGIYNIPDRHELSQKLYDDIFSPKMSNQLKVVATLGAWHRRLTTLPEPALDTSPLEDHIAGNKVFLHYEHNMAFLKEGEIFNNLPRIAHIPTVIVQGRYDMATPYATAYKVHKALSQSVLDTVTEAGHRGLEPLNAERIITWTDRIAKGDAILKI